MTALEFFVPSNRRDAKGRPTHVDGWNEYIKAQNVNRYVAAAMERENVGSVANHAAAAMLQHRFEPLDGPALVTVTFVEINRRRDVPNVYGGLKWVLDGLTRPRGSKYQGAGAIVDDSPKWCEVETRLEVDAERPGVRIRIEPLEAE
ncbi:hypothetical protein [Eggerthella guodeyinii]|uniref:Uncharacterized protein n=1 Tax=Eggerthella guodeyinii TaxID=2690837 RepID=A0A6N7RLM9_9ACTN|nr:hypothetical protein [Eggerthella guodeyinii]MRX82235.1 hypothetical protein [Eggerthella guodeyinii]